MKILIYNYSKSMFVPLKLYMLEEVLRSSGMDMVTACENAVKYMAEFESPVPGVYDYHTSKPLMIKIKVEA
jgi:hypothetical protein